MAAKGSTEASEGRHGAAGRGILASADATVLEGCPEAPTMVAAGRNEAEEGRIVAVGRYEAPTFAKGGK